jgi:hypothetical protein
MYLLGLMSPTPVPMPVSYISSPELFGLMSPYGYGWIRFNVFFLLERCEELFKYEKQITKRVVTLPDFTTILLRKCLRMRLL